MKRKICMAVTALIISVASYSQSIILNAYGSYIFDDQVDSYYSNTSYFSGTIKGGFLWGGGLEFRLKHNYGIEVLYQRLDTHAPMEYYDHNAILDPIKHADLDVSIDYILAGGVKAFKANEKVEPYGGLLLGVGILNAENPESKTKNSATRFAWGLRGGMNLWVSSKVGVKLQAQLLSVPQGAGGSLYFGTGGAGAGVSTYSTMLQFALGGGLTFKLKEDK